MDATTLALLVALAFIAGGILKGATGFGAPLLAVPVMALSVDMAFAITVFAIPNLLPNLWQAWKYRADRLPATILVPFGIAGAVGSGVGIWGLATLPQDLLAGILGVILVIYIGTRLIQPKWRISMETARLYAAPAGFLGGVFQSGSGLSAPVSLTYLTAMHPARETFMQAISVFFASVGLVQIPALIAAGLLTPVMSLLSLAALVPLVVGIAIGTILGRKFTQRSFNIAMLLILSILAVQLLWNAAT